MAPLLTVYYNTKCPVCGSVAAPTCYTPFRKGRVECTSARTCAFGRVTFCC